MSMSISPDGYAVRCAHRPPSYSFADLFLTERPLLLPARLALRYNKTKKGLELLRRQGTLALLQAGSGPDRDEDEDEDEEDGPLEGLAQLRDVVKVLRRLAGKAR
jgi:hypothetical protein